MTLKKILSGILIVLLAVGMFAAGWFLKDIDSGTDNLFSALTNAAFSNSLKPNSTGSEEIPEETEAEEIVEKPDFITMAIYPYVSNIELFQKVLSQMWAEMEPDVQLQFIDWNCYSDPYPNNIDVITYDALFLEHLVESGYIQPLEADTLGDTSDIIPFAMEGARYQDHIYGMPFLVCSSFLMYNKEDTALDQVQNFAQLCKELAARKAVNPDDGVFAGFLDEAPFLYLDAYIDYNGEYTTFEHGPTMTPPDTTIHNRLQEMRANLATIPEGESYQSAFSQGLGSACYAYSEALYFMGDVVDDLTIRSISFFEGENIQMFYADVASLCSQVTDPVKKEYCMKLINLIGSEEFLTQLVYGTGDVQYMLPAREQVYLTAMEQYPIYETLHTLAMDENNRVFRFGIEIYDYKNLASVAFR